MKTSQDKKTIKDLVDLFKARMMIANPEYQRGVVWTEVQQKKLIDSLMRGYTLPLIYLHETKEIIAGHTREGFEIIDGQQRLNAICKYVDGAFRLFDPGTENDKAKFPRYLLEQPCPWAGKFFHELPPKQQDEFLKKTLSLAMIQSSDTNEVRDLFVRLQEGSVLNAQERRDAWPGGMNNFVLRLGGKPSITRYPGHEFFKEIMRAKPGSDRGKTRQLAAQITSLLLAQRNAFGETFPDINLAAIDQLYYDNLNFDPNGEEGRRIWNIFDLLYRLLRDGTRPKLRGHEAIHAALLVDRLRDDFTPAWQEEFAPALDEFMLNLKGADKVDESNPKYAYWSQYGTWTRANSDRGEKIALRHSFYLEHMLARMPATVLKDPSPQFSEDMRELVYFQQRKTCAVCGSIVIWADAEIHHVKEHQHGGKTALENAALVHNVCHPKSNKDVAEFAQKWKRRNGSS
ncbi:MAG: DUF262 domain-containing protein [Gammaproteobacteria bacterium]|nr:DUF262 domain-containing protein [Gammaproteobacteria bacterium]